MNRQAALQALSQNNPFSSGVASEPWGGRYPDVSDINSHVHGPLLQLAQRLADKPQEALAALVLGEAGYGKTHLLGRLVDAANLAAAGDAPFAFAYIHPLLDPHRPFRHLLQEVMISLSHAATPGHPLRQLHFLVHPLLMAGWRSLLAAKPAPKEEKIFQQANGDPVWFFNTWWPKQKKKFTSALASQLLSTLQQEHPRIDRQTFKVLLQIDQPESGALVFSWLRGEILDDQESQTLGVTDRQPLREEAQEEEARTILATLAILLVRRHAPMLVCFDRLENLQTPAHYQAFELLIDFLVDEMPSVLPIVLARGVQWEDFRKHLKLHVVQRLESNRFDLRGCPPATAVQLVESRVDFVLNQAWRQDPHTHQSLLNDLTEPFQGRQFPREILATANKKLLALVDEPEPTPSSKPERVLAGALAGQREKILAAFASQPPDGQRLGQALVLLITHGVDNGQATLHKLADQAWQINSGSATLFVDASRHHLEIIHTLEQALALAPSSKPLLWLRDGRCLIPPLPKWPATNTLLQQFLEQGGVHWPLQREEAAMLYAIPHVQQHITSGDVARFSPQEPLVAISEAEFQRFIGKQLSSSPHLARLLTALSATPATTSPPEPPLLVKPGQVAHVVETLTHTLESLPAHMGMASHLVALLKQRGVETTLEILLDGVEKTPERFTILPSANGVILQLRGKWRHEQAQR